MVARSKLQIDGSRGEGGGQLVRTALSLSVLTGRPVEIDRIRAGRSNPGLRPQHVTVARALATICSGDLEGDELGSTKVAFRPGSRPEGGAYEFDVAEAAEHGSAGSVGLLFQSLLLPLAFAEEPSALTLRGGTHVPWSPSFDYLQEVFLPVVGEMGLSARIRLGEWGFYPRGGGRIEAQIDPLRAGPESGEGGGRTGPNADRDAAPGNESEGRAGTSLASLEAIERLDRGNLESVSGRAIASNLPAHIPQRMTDRSRSLIEERFGRVLDLKPLRVTGPGPGAGLFLTARYQHASAGFAALGEKGKPSEDVAEEAVEQLFSFHDSGGVVDRHLADQILLPAALARGTTTYRTASVSGHLRTQKGLLEEMIDVSIELTAEEGRPGFVRVDGIGARAP